MDKQRNLIILAAVVACVLAKIVLLNTGNKNIVDEIAKWFKDDDDIIIN